MPASAVAQDRTVAVNGEVTQQVPNDTAGLGFSVSRERRSRGAALSAVAGGLRGVIAAVQTVPGVGAGDVTSGRISIRRVPRHKDAVLYRASRESASSCTSRCGRRSDQRRDHSGSDRHQRPQLLRRQLEAAYNKALVAAFDQARARASALAARQVAALGPVVSIAEGGGVEPG